MKNSTIFLLSIITITFSISGKANAFTFSGEYMFTVSEYNNDTPTIMNLIETQAEDWFLNEKNTIRNIEFDFFSKVDEPAISAPGMTVTYYAGNMGGEWKTDVPIEFYTVKGSQQFALYWLAGGLTSGFFSTEHLLNRGGNQPAISHISGWNPIDGPPNPVPEPATMALLGIGLIGIAGGIRKIKS